MVQIIDRRPTFGEELGGALGRGAGAGLQQGMEDRSLRNKYGIDLAGITDTQTRNQIISDELKYGRARQQASASQNVDYTGKGKNKPSTTSRSSKSSNINIEKSSPQNKTVPRENPQFINESEGVQTNQPDEFSNQQSSGNLPQRQTSGQVEPVADVNQLWEDGQRIADERTKKGLPTTAEEGFNIAQATNQQRIANNQLIKGEEAEQINEQIRYAALGESALNKYFGELSPDGKTIISSASPKMLSILEKNAVRYAKENKSEAQIKSLLFQDAKELKDDISNITSSPKPKRAWTRAGQKSLDTGREAEKEELAIRNKLKSLLEKGLHDEARVALAKTGRYPEEIENLVASQGESTKKILSDFDPIKKIEAQKKPKWTPPEFEDILTNIGQPWKRFQKQEVYKTEDEAQFSQNLSQVLESDPKTNLILLRKSYEDKGVDWRLFKDQLDRLVSEGKFKMDGEQRNQYDRLDEPPLDGLDKILFDFHLKGR